MNRIEKSLVLTAIIYMAFYIPYFLIRIMSAPPHSSLPDEIFPLHFLGMGLNFIALVVIIRDLYKRPFPNPNSKLTWLLLILWTGGIGFMIYTFKYALWPREKGSAPEEEQ